MTDEEYEDKIEKVLAWLDGDIARTHFRRALMGIVFRFDRVRKSDARSKHVADEIIRIIDDVRRDGNYRKSLE